MSTFTLVKNMITFSTTGCKLFWFSWGSLYVVLLLLLLRLLSHTFAALKYSTDNLQGQRAQTSKNKMFTPLNRTHFSPCSLLVFTIRSWVCSFAACWRKGYNQCVFKMSFIQFRIYPKINSKQKLNESLISY